MLFAALAFSVMGPLVKAVAPHIPAGESVFARALGGLGLSYWMVKRAGVSPWGRDRRLLLLRGVFGTISLIAYFEALTKLPLADATAIMYTNPIWTAFLARRVQREPLSPRVLGASLASLVGVVLIARPSFLFGAGDVALPLVPVLLALLAAFGSAAAYVTVREVSKTDHPLVIVFWFTLVALPASVPGLAAAPVWPTAGEWLGLAGVAISVQVGQVFLTRSLELEPAGRATSVSYVQVVFAFLWGVLVFGEALRAEAVAGATLIVASALLVALTPPARSVLTPEARPSTNASASGD